MPESLLTRRYRRQVKLVHVEKDELCVWHPRKEDVEVLGQNSIEVVYIEGTVHWFGGMKHNYGHFTVAELPAGKFSLQHHCENRWTHAGLTWWIGSLANGNWRCKGYSKDYKGSYCIQMDYGKQQQCSRLERKAKVFTCRASLAMHWTNGTLTGKI